MGREGIDRLHRRGAAGQAPRAARRQSRPSWLPFRSPRASLPLSRSTLSLPLSPPGDTHTRTATTPLHSYTTPPQQHTTRTAPVHPARHPHPLAPAPAPADALQVHPGRRRPARRRPPPPARRVPRHPRPAPRPRGGRPPRLPRHRRRHPRRAPAQQETPHRPRPPPRPVRVRCVPSLSSSFRLCPSPLPGSLPLPSCCLPVPLAAREPCFFLPHHSARARHQRYHIRAMRPITPD